ncbi:alpha/beta fold hydrolase [Herbiconiux sp. YIM B11900]|uniref:alpha/beta fold hydrolase n=1 Tax=Herbiconiux sp. YIM B11900 TaxID=3404131 RepID=UPI003F87E9A3
MSEVESGGVRIAYERFGDAADPAVLLVHGFASNRSANWMRARWAGPLTEAGFSGVALDLRGHGESARPRTLAAYTPSRFRDDLVAVLDDASIASAHVIGYSLGARLAWDLALRHPERVRSLVLGGAPVTGSFAGFDFDRARALLTTPQAESAPEPTPDARPVTAQERAAAPGIAHRAPDARPLPSGERAPAPRAPDATARYVRMAAGVPGNDPHALLRVAAAQQRHGFRPLARIPSQPLLFAAGTDDELAVPIEQLASRIGHASFVPLPGRDHITAVTSRVFKDEAVAFLRAVESSTR